MSLYLNFVVPSAFFLSTLKSLCSCSLYRTENKNDNTSLHDKIDKIIASHKKKLGLQKPIEVLIKSTTLSPLYALGNSLPIGKAGIQLDPGSVEHFDDPCLEFCLAHELTHIVNNDLITMPIIGGVVSLVTTLAMGILWPSSFAFVPYSWLLAVVIGPVSLAALMGTAVGFTAFSCFSQWREKRADLGAAQVCSKEAIASAVQFFQRLKDENQATRNNLAIPAFLKNVLVTSSGEIPWDVWHPSLQKRIDYLTPLTTPQLIQEAKQRQRELERRITTARILAKWSGS